MNQAVMTRPGRIEYSQVPKPVIADHQVLIEVMRIGICGSDIHVYHGKHPYTRYPVVQGHEMAGIVAETGAAVTGLAVGDSVTIQPQVFCGRCYPCRHGDYHICDNLEVMGFQTTGAASEFFAADGDKVIKLPPEMSLDQGAVVEPLAVAVHALRRSGMDIPGKNILVLGAGPIGNLVAQAARGMGAASVMITDLSDFRLDIARQCGINFPVHAGRTALADAIEAHWGCDKADLILECVGAGATMAQAIGNARKGSGIVVVGVFAERPSVDMGLVQDRELQLTGTLMYQRADYLKAIELICGGAVNAEALITNRFAFRDYQKAYECIEENKDLAMKVMIHVRDGL